MYQLELKTCSDCGDPIRSGLHTMFADMCFHCAKKREPELLSQWKISAEPYCMPLAEKKLAAIGASSVEASSDLARVPFKVKALLPKQAVAQLLNADLPTRGFGLIGGQGIGKSSVLAALVKGAIAKSLSKRIESMDRLPEPYGDPWHAGAARNIKWMNWPESAMKIKFVGREGAQNPVEFIEENICPNLLVLDDLGRERSKGSYTEDFAMTVLDQIVDGRCRENKPILWTSNVNPEGLSEIYGAAMMSRLLSLAPPVVLPALPDLRLETA